MNGIMSTATKDVANKINEEQGNEQLRLGVVGEVQVEERKSGERAGIVGKKDRCGLTLMSECEAQFAGVDVSLEESKSKKCR